MKTVIPSPAGVLAPIVRAIARAIPSLRHGDEHRIAGLWRDGKRDTLEIAKELGLREADVYNVIARRPAQWRRPMW